MADPGHTVAASSTWQNATSKDIIADMERVRDEIYASPRVRLSRLMAFCEHVRLTLIGRGFLAYRSGALLHAARASDVPGGVCTVPFAQIHLGEFFTETFAGVPEEAEGSRLGDAMAELERRIVEICNRD